jgi:hypothetical protein
VVTTERIINFAREEENAMGDLSHPTNQSPDACPSTAPDRRCAMTPAAERALAEAQARRTEIDRKTRAQPKEIAGRKGPDPARYGDWEVKGIAVDF